MNSCFCPVISCRMTILNTSGRAEFSSTLTSRPCLFFKNLVARATKLLQIRYS